MDDFLKRLQNEYADLYANYIIEKAEINLDINHFNERLRISLSSLPGFNSNIIESEAYRSSLKQSFLLNDFWFTYETLLSSVNSLLKSNYNFYSITSEVANSKYSKQFIELLSKQVQILLNKKNIDILFENLLEKSKGDLKTKIKRIIVKIEKGDKLDIEELIAITYAIRIIFVHEGRIHFKGMSINSIKEITTILLNILKVLIYIIAILKLF